MRWNPMERALSISITPGSRQFVGILGGAEQIALTRRKKNLRVIRIAYPHAAREGHHCGMLPSLVQATPSPVANLKRSWNL